MKQSGIAVYLYPEDYFLPRNVRLLDAAARYSGRDTSGWLRAESEKGKPYFANEPDVHFSVSHSGRFWACAFASEPVGLDIQQHVPCAIERLSRRFFHSEENAYLEEKSYAQKDFFGIWTAKESFLKRTGEGIAGGLDTFSVLSPLPGGLTLRQLKPPEGYSLCVCAGDTGRVELTYI